MMNTVAELPVETRAIISAPRHERRVPMSYEEFLKDIKEATHAEWVNGETIIFMPPLIRHQQIVGFLYGLLLNFVQHYQLGEVLTAPTEMKVTTESNAREPDILFIANEHLDRLTQKQVAGPADLVVEVISPE